MKYAARAEEAGFHFALISDHFHPWTRRQGHSPFVWGVLGAIAHATRRLRVGTGVAALIIRLHPAVVAQAAATASLLRPGRFFLGVGAGEHLNEHILGDPWPPPSTRVEMLEEALGVIRLLWQGGSHDHRGPHSTVEDARIFDLPDPLPPSSWRRPAGRTTRIAAELGDGVLSVGPDAELVRRFATGRSAAAHLRQDRSLLGTRRGRGPSHRPRDVARGRPPGPLMAELRVPEDFEAATSVLDEDQVARALVLGPEPDTHVRAVEDFVRAGFDHVAVRQVGPPGGLLRLLPARGHPRFGEPRGSGSTPIREENHADEHRT